MRLVKHIAMKTGVFEHNSMHSVIANYSTNVALEKLRKEKLIKGEL